MLPKFDRLDIAAVAAKYMTALRNAAMLYYQLRSCGKDVSFEPPFQRECAPIAVSHSDRWNSARACYESIHVLRSLEHRALAAYSAMCFVVDQWLAVHCTGTLVEFTSRPANDAVE